MFFTSRGQQILALVPKNGTWSDEEEEDLENIPELELEQRVKEFFEGAEEMDFNFFDNPEPSVQDDSHMGKYHTVDQTLRPVGQDCPTCLSSLILLMVHNLPRLMKFLLSISFLFYILDDADLNEQPPSPTIEFPDDLIDVFPLPLTSPLADELQIVTYLRKPFCKKTLESLFRCYHLFKIYLLL